MAKKIFIVFILLLGLGGCQKEVTTFSQVIKDGQVEMDGIEYDILSLTEVTYEYNEKDAVTRVTSKYDDEEHKTEFVYSGDLLIEEKRFSNQLDTKILYHYDDLDREIKRDYIYEVGTLSIESDYTKDGKRSISKDQNGHVQYVQEEVLDDKGRVLELKKYDPNGILQGTVENRYDNALLITSVSMDRDGKKTTSYYEYNNLGDLIFWYTVYHLDQPIVMVYFYEYGYNKKSLPITVNIYRIQSLIEKEDIRDYWDF